MDKLNEDFTKLYLRWKGGGVRKEDKISKELVYQFIKEYKINKDDVIINESCADFNCDVTISDVNDLTFKFGKVSGNFDVSSIGIKDLRFMPTYVGGVFEISDNLLESFEGCPEEVVGEFLAYDSNSLESLKGLPKHIGGNLIITTPEEPDKFTEDDIPEGTVVDGVIRFSIRRRR